MEYFYIVAASYFQYSDFTKEGKNVILVIVKSF